MTGFKNNKDVFYYHEINLERYGHDYAYLINDINEQVTNEFKWSEKFPSYIKLNLTKIFY